MLLKRVQTVEFDPSKKSHREAVRAFSVRNAWSDSPLRFSHDPTYGCIAEQVQAKLLKWYMAKESSRYKNNGNARWLQKEGYR